MSRKYRVPIDQARPGDILIFKGKGLPYWVLSRALKLFEWKWDRWGWHMAILWKVTPEGWQVLEAIAQGVSTTFYTKDRLTPENVRVYQWLPQKPAQDILEEFEQLYLRRPYDVLVYIWTAVQYLFRHFWNRRIPRLLDDRFTCWELVSEWCDYNHKNWHSKYDCPAITDFLKRVEEA